MAENWMRLREFARRRGVALSAVQKAISAGRVTAVRRNDKGRLKAIEFAQASAQWDANTDPGEAAKNGKFLGAAESNTCDDEGARGATGQGAAPALGPVTELVASQAGQPAGGEPPAGESDASVAGTAAAPGPDKDPHGYYKARADRERINAAQQQLDYAKALGLVVSTDEQRRVSARRYRAIKDQFLNIPDRIATELAAQRDAGQVHAMLTAEIKRVLNELSDDAAAEAARGAPISVAA